jgi:DNA polymerase I-like protein with 3'-5' exonuclease and polymerase domains
MIEADLSGADALVVAREAGDKELENDIISGIDLHSKNATDLFGSEFTRLEKTSPARYQFRQQTKQGVHATNYGAIARTLALILGWPLVRADLFQRTWFSKHPGIYDWHRRTERQLSKDRTIQNAFGYRIIYFDRIESLLGQALAWVPQSTVAETCFRGALEVEKKCPWADLRLQVHDSLLMQVHKSIFPACIPELKAALHNPVPYDPPLIIPWKISASAKSWGDVEELKDAA